MKKFFTLFLALFVGSSSFAQFAVLETNSAASLITAINSLYSTYDEINSMIEQVQQGYEQIEAAYKQMATIDWDKMTEAGTWSNEGGLEGAWENIGNARANFRSKAKLVSNNLAQAKAAKEKLQNSGLSFGGTKYTLKDLCGAGSYDKTVFSLCNNIMTSQFDQYAKIGKAANGEMTPEEIEENYAKWGLSPELQQAVNVASTVASEGITALCDQVADAVQAANAESLGAEIEYINKMSDIAAESNSQVEVQRVNNEIGLHTMNLISNLKSSFEIATGAWANEEKRKQIEREAQARQRAIDRAEEKIENARASSIKEMTYGK